jgi:hypothetical protein
MLTQILQMASWATAIFQQDEPERYCAHGWESALAAFDPRWSADRRASFMMGETCGRQRAWRGSGVAALAGTIPQVEVVF